MPPLIIEFPVDCLKVVSVRDDVNHPGYENFKRILVPDDLLSNSIKRVSGNNAASVISSDAATQIVTGYRTKNEYPDVIIGHKLRDDYVGIIVTEIPSRGEKFIDKWHQFMVQWGLWTDDLITPFGKNWDIDRNPEWAEVRVPPFRVTSSKPNKPTIGKDGKLLEEKWWCVPLTEEELKSQDTTKPEESYAREI
jgi:hypothetical protein